MSNLGRQRFTKPGIAFAGAVAVWLVFYFWFPSAPLTAAEFLVVFVLAYLCVLAAFWLIDRRRRERRPTQTSQGSGPEAADGRE